MKTYKKLFLILGLLCSHLAFSQQVEKPISNQTSGIYTSDIILQLYHIEPSVTIFYTLNGDEPGPSDFTYTGPITLSNREGDANYQSMIPTNPSLTFPLGDYNETRANSRGWAPPYAEVYKLYTVRFRAYKAGFVPSETVTQTFMIDPLGANRYTLPILSIVVDNDGYFSDENGIYVWGNHPSGNYTRTGVDWERMAHLDLFDNNGNLVYTHSKRSRVHGGGSRHSAKKSIRLYGNTGDKKNFNFQFFDDTEQTKFKRLIVRGGGHRPDCFPRDDLSNFITKGLNVEQQNNKHVILFINGEFWGTFTIKEKTDRFFIQNLYGIDDDYITIMDQEYDVKDGYQVDSDTLSMIEMFIHNEDMSIPENYQFVKDRVDIDNYIDYMCAQIYLSNEDWVFSNIKIWKKTGPFDPSKPVGEDGKYRWIFWDLDGTFGGSCTNAFFTVNTLNAATIESGLYASYTRFFRGLLENPEFKNQFINRMMDLLNSWFKPKVVGDKMMDLYDVLTPNMFEEANRWKYPSMVTNLADRYTEIPSLDRWNNTWGLLQTFSAQRPRKIRDHIMAKWAYPDSCALGVDVNNQNMGRVKVHSILIDDNLQGVSSEVYPWYGNYMQTVTVPLIAIPLPGYQFVEWLETGDTNDTIYWTPEGSTFFTAIFEPSDNYSPVVINEVMLSNSNYIQDNHGDYDDWLELYNPNPYPVNLSNCKLMKSGISWSIPNGTIIGADGYLLFWHDKETYQGWNHVNFKLSNSNETVYLVSPNGVIINFINYSYTPTNQSYGRYPNGSNSFSTFTYPTPLQNNNISGQNENIKQTDLIAFPNPANHIVNFNQIINFDLYDLNGRKICSKTQSQQLDVSHLNNGVYILVTDKNQTLKISVLK